MKKFKKIFIQFLSYNSLIFISITLSACSTATLPEDYDYAIFDGQKAVVVKENGDKLEKLSEKNVGKQGVDFYREGLFEDKDYVYGKTSYESPGILYYFKMNKKDLKTDFESLGGHDSFTSTFDGEYIYSTTLTNRIEFRKYDKDLKEVMMNAYTYPEGEDSSSTELFVRGDKLYLLAGVLDNTTNILSNELWVMDKNFKIEDRFDIDYTDKSAGAFFRVAQVDNKLYITEVWDGTKDATGEPNGGSRVVVYDLDKRSSEVIELATTYPKFIHYDEKKKLLQVQHDVLYTGDTIITFIDVTTGQQRVVTMDRDSDSEPFYKEINGKYYYLFDGKLVKYDYDTDQKISYDLANIDVKSADILVEK